MPESPRVPPVPVPGHVTMPLLDVVTRNALDQDYVHVAERRAESGLKPRGSRGTFGAILVLVLFGVLVSIAAAQNSRNAESDATSRAGLVDQIEQRRAQLSSAQDKIGRRRAAIPELEQEQASAAEDLASVNARLDRLLARTGFGPVRGPGVRIVVDDSPSGISSEAVRDSDLALLVDALWGVGAEAIAINNQRLTVLSAISNVGVAVHVNGRPLAPPYTVQAIGDPLTMQADLVTSPRGQAFLALADAYDFAWDMSNRDNLSLPAAAMRPLRSAVLGMPGNNGRGPDEEDVTP